MARGLAATRGHAGSTAAARLGWSGVRAKPLGWLGPGALRLGVLATTAAALSWLRLRFGEDHSSSRRSGLRRSATLPDAVPAPFTEEKALLRRRVHRCADPQRLIGRASQSAHPECFGRADQLSMRRAAQPTMRGSLGSCWRGERDAHSLACQILTASDIGLAPTRVKRTR